MSENDEKTGSGPLDLAEEIRLLVELVVEHAAPWLEGLISAGHGCTDHDSGGWCPLCAIVGIFRGERPEFVARLMEQAAQLVALLRAVLADRWEPEAACAHAGVPACAEGAHGRRCAGGSFAGPAHHGDQARRLAAGPGELSC